jgi:hypothetical protein
LTSAALPYENDLMGYHLRQYEAAKTAQSLEGEAFSQMCLDCVFSPGTLALNFYPDSVLIPSDSNFC